MKKSAILGALALVLVSLTGIAPAAADSPTLTTFEFPGGSLTTTNLDAWGGVNVITYPVAFDVDCGGVGEVGLTMYVYGLDMSGVNYGGDWGWPPGLEDLGAIAAAGIAGDPTPRFDMINGAWNQFHSSPGPGAKSWDAKPADHDNGYTKWFRQVWSSDMSGNKVHPDGPSHMYNVESRVVSVEDGGTGNPSDYCTFDLKLQLTPLDLTAGAKEYRMETWSRMHRAASNDEGCYWKWNTAIVPAPPQDTNPENAWVGGYPAGSWRDLTANDFAMVFPFVSIANWGTMQTQYHTISWERVVVEGCPILEQGMATGGGWLIPEASSAHGLVNLGGKATFGLVAKQKDNTSSGQLEFQYHADNLNLKSTSYDWVTVSSTQVIFEGTGTLNDEPGYKFRVWAFDGNKAGGQPDRFTIRIWTNGSSYESPTYRAEGDLGGGQIVVHKK